MISSLASERNSKSFPHATFQCDLECSSIIEFKTTDTDIITIDHFLGCAAFHLGPLRYGEI